MKGTVIAILTLQRHEKGVWIVRLVERLKAKVAALSVDVQVVVLEKLLGQPTCVSSAEISDVQDDEYPLSQFHKAPSCWLGLVNRVSDAAEPWEVKACLAILQLAKLVWKIPIVNGPEAYALCTNKWCHHVLFSNAQLSSPTTVMTMTSTPVNTEIRQQQQEDALKLLRRTETALDEEHLSISTQLEYLIKPNAGGFGVGIQRHSLTLPNPVLDSPQSADASSIIRKPAQGEWPIFTDRITLLQTYVRPHQELIYRVWFLMGKVQCAVVRTVKPTPSSSGKTATEAAEQEETQVTTPSLPYLEFTSGCVGGVCARPNNPVPAYPTTESHIQPWTVPKDVQREIEEQLLPVLPSDAHCGSVEFLYDHQGRRLYFDLNLLSTLPLSLDENNNNCGDHADDPWEQLTVAVIRVLDTATFESTAADCLASC